MKQVGRVWKFGDDVNTDYIIPGKYLELIEPEDMAKHAMEGIDPGFPDKIENGDIVVGGRNFGCGSSREHAPLALKYAGVSIVVAESFARIFYRNSINIGLPALECPGITLAVNDGEILEINVEGGVILNKRSGVNISFIPLPNFMVDILNEGGLAPYLRKNKENW